MSNPVLEFKHVWKRFRKGERFDSLRDLVPMIARRMGHGISREQLRSGEFWALQDVSFDVQRGEAVGIIGANGAGKSTILKLLSRILQPTRGEIRVHGKLSALIEIGAGFHADLTGRENIYLNGTILGMKRQEIDKKFDAIVAFAGLEEFIDTPVKRYSSGMYARLGFSVAAHVDPDILVVDEVLSVGDWAFQRRCMERMTTLFRSGCTVIFVSHNLRAVASLCERSLLLVQGRIIKLGSTPAVISHYMAMNSEPDAERTPSDIYISKLIIRDREGEAVDFQSGERAWVDIEVTARTAETKLAVLMAIQNQEYYEVFVTSTERLGHGTFSLKPGETWRCAFEVSLHLAPGTYRVGGEVKRYDTGRVYDAWGGRTLHVHSTTSIGGSANLYPRVVASEKSSAEPPDRSPI